MSVGSPIEVKQLSMESYADMADMQDRLIAVLMEVVGVFLWASVLEGTHRKVGESVSSYCVHAVIAFLRLCWYCVTHWESNVCCLCLLSLDLSTGVEEFLLGSGPVLSRPLLTHSCSRDQTTVSVTSVLSINT